MEYDKSRFSKLRIEVNNNWNQIEFPIYAAIKNYSEKNIITPIKLPMSMNEDYQICLSNIIEAFELYPKHIDIGFERLLLTIERLDLSPTLKQKYLNFSKNVQNNVMQFGLEKELEAVINNVPLKVFSYMTSRLFGNYDIVNDKFFDDQTKHIWNRLGRNNSNNNNYFYHENLYKFLLLIGFKYRLYNYSEVKEFDAVKRKISLLLKKAMIERVSIKYDDLIYDLDESNKNRLDAILSNMQLKNEEVIINLSLEEKIHLMIQGDILTTRNDRFHGRNMATFKSSKADIEIFNKYIFNFFILYSFVTIKMVDYIEDSNDRLIMIESIRIFLTTDFKKLY